MKALRIASIVTALCIFSAMAADDDAKAGRKKKEKAVKEKLAAEQLPAGIKNAAEKAAPGLVLGEIRRRTRGEEIRYIISGKAGEKFFEVQIAADGTVLKTEENDAEGKKIKIKKSKEPAPPVVPEAPGDF